MAETKNKKEILGNGIGRDVVVCLDSPGWGGSERDLVRVLPRMAERITAVIHGKAVAPGVKDFFERYAVQVSHCRIGNRLLDSVWAIRAGLRWHRQYPQAQFLVWAHHCDSQRWLQVALAWRKAKFVIAERLMPATRAEAFNSVSRRAIKQWVGRRAHRIVLCGYSQIDNYSEWFGISRTRIHVVPNTRRIDAIETRVRELRANPVALRRSLNLPEGIIIANLGRLSHQKDQGTLVEAVKHLSHQGHPVSALLIGAGDNEGRLRQAASMMGNSVIFAGEQSDPLPWLAAAQMFAFPSRSEGLPGALIEAMASGLPCVATNIPGNTELVRDESTGLLVPPESASALAGALARLIREPALGQRLAAAASTHVRAKYDEAIEVAGWRGVFENEGA
jgi:glycosyltransferase involved in cell wall biosynthesis